MRFLAFMRTKLGDVVRVRTARNVTADAAVQALRRLAVQTAGTSESIVKRDPRAVGGVVELWTSGPSVLRRLQAIGETIAMINRTDRVWTPAAVGVLIDSLPIVDKRPTRLARAAGRQVALSSAKTPANGE